MSSEPYQETILCALSRSSRRCAATAFVIVLAASLTTAWSAEIVPLAPAHESFVIRDDFFISFAFSSLPEPARKVRVYLDDQDLSQDARVSDKTVTVIPADEVLADDKFIGPHRITVVVYGLYHRRPAMKSIRCYVLRDNSASAEEKLAMLKKGKTLAPFTPVEFRSTHTIFASADYETFNDSAAPRAQLDAYGNASLGDRRAAYNLSLTTGESRHRQTLQRFKIGADYKHIAGFSLGDNYPTYHRLILDNRRIRGIEVHAATPSRLLSFSGTWGVSHRAVEPWLSRSEDLIDTLSTHSDTFTHNDSLPYFTQGTYRRGIAAGRLQLGSGQRFNVGLCLLKARDDPHAIHQLFSIDQSGDTVPAGSTPEDNLVVGADARLSLFRRRVTAWTNYAFSIHTTDITNGSRSADEISNLFDSASIPFDPAGIEGLLVLNESTTPLPLPADSSGTVNSASLFKGMAWDAGLSARTDIGPAMNTASITYYLYGPAFQSLGNDYLTADRSGITCTDELRLLEGKLTLATTLTVYRNDLLNMKSSPARTVEASGSVALLWSPTLPSITLTLSTVNDRDLSSASTASASATQHNTHRTLASTVSYSRPVAQTRSTATLSLAASRFTMTGTDAVPSLNLPLTTVAAGVTSFFDNLPLDTRVSGLSTISHGQYGLARIRGSLGGTWHIRRDIVAWGGDIGMEHLNDFNADARNEWFVKNSVSWQVRERHRFFAKAGLVRTVGESFIDRQVGVMYEMRL